MGLNSVRTFLSCRMGELSASGLRAAGAALAVMVLAGTLPVLHGCDGSRIRDNGTFHEGGWFDTFADTAGLPDSGPHDTVTDVEPKEIGQEDIPVWRPDIKVSNDATGPPCENDLECQGAFDDLGPCEDAFCSYPPGICVRVPRVDGARCETLCALDGRCQDGDCTRTTPRDCSDGVDCTVDSCDPETGCLSEPDARLCDDDDECTADVCDPIRGCLYEEIPFCRCETDDDCQDGESCTTDKCDTRRNVCDHIPVADGTRCDDGNECTRGDLCQDGVCDPGPDTCPTSEICDDGEDNDGDGAVDCDDDDCRGGVGCDAPVGCDIAHSVGCDEILRGTTAGGASAIDGYGCRGWDESGPEDIISFRADEAGDVVVTLHGDLGGPDHDVFLLDASCDPMGGCVAGGQQSLVFSAARGATYYLVVDGHEGDEGDYEISIDCRGGSGETNCSDGIDDDGDGHVDCRDVDCLGTLDCAERDCTNGIDDDQDGLADCDDPECAATAACVSSCDAPLTLGCDARIAGTTTDDDNRFSNYGCTVWDESGPEDLYGFAPQTSGPVVITVTPQRPDLDLDVFLLDATCTPGSGCLGYGNQMMTFEAGAGSSYHIVVDGWGGQAGSYVMTVDCLGAEEEGDCGNGFDDDGDGYEDCNDADCAGSPDCVEKDCRDGRDDDRDGLVDCADNDCIGDPGCIESICGDAALPVTCDARIVGDTRDGNSRFQGYGCVAWSEGGPELVYAFTPTASGLVQMTLRDVPSGTDLDLFLLDATCDPSGGCLAADGQAISFTAEAGATYHVVVDGWDGAAGPFTLLFDCLGDGSESECGDGADNDGDGHADCADTDCADAVACNVSMQDDDLEDNDRPQDASPLGTGGTLGGLASLAGDDDWFELYACRGGSVSAVAYADLDGADLTLELYADDGSALLQRSEGSDGTASLLWSASREGTVYLRVVPPLSGGVGYTLTTALDTDGCTGSPEICSGGGDEDGDGDIDCADADCADSLLCLACNEDDSEENDNAQTATFVDGESLFARIAAPGDDDWYRFSVCDGGALGITALPSSGGLALELYESDGTTLIDESRFSGTFERVVVVDPGSDVLARVTGAAGVCSRYDLQVQEKCGTICNSDLYEPNDSRGQAYNNASGGSLSSLRLSPGDEDWFMVRANNCDSPVISAAFDWDPMQGDLDLELYDANMQLLDSAIGPTGSSASVVAPGSGGNSNYLRVIGNGAICLSYSGFLTATCPPACGQNDVYEPNDTRLGGWGNGNTGTFSSLALYPGDEDWFWFDSCAGGTASALVTLGEGEGDIDLELYDDAGNLLDASEGTGGSESVAIQTGGISRLYVRVFGARPSEICRRYSLVTDTDCGGGSGCLDDIYEDDDTPGAARDVGDGTQFQNLKAATNDDDWFKVHVCAGGTLSVSATFAAADGNIDLELYDKDGVRMLASSYGLAGTESINWSSATTDTYLVRVFGQGALCAPYALNIETGACGTDPGDECRPDPYEEDDRPESATDTRTGGTYNALTAEPDDDDWFRVTTCSGGTLNVSATWTAEDGEVDLTVYAADGVTTLGQGMGFQGSASVTAPAGNNQELLVRAKLRRGECAPYSLDLVVEGCGGAECVADAFEEDDGPGAANDVGQGGTFSSLTAERNDPDWFAVDMCPEGSLTAIASTTGEGAPVGLQILRSNGVSVLGSDAGMSGSATVTASPGDESRLYVMTQSSGDCRPYSLRIMRSGCGGGGCEADGWEPNDDYSQAADAGAGAQLSGLSLENGEEDWFSVQVCAGGALVASTTHEPSLGDLDLYLYASDGVSLLDSSRGLSGSEQVAWTTSFATTLYVRADGVTGECLPYDIELAVDGCSGSCFDDLHEENDAPWDATAAGDGDQFLDLKATTGDADWFAVPICAGGYISATATINPSAGDLGLRLYDGDGATVLDTASAAGGQATVTAGVSRPGTVFVRALGVGDVCAPYQLEIDVENCENQCLDDGWEDNDIPSLPVDAGVGAAFTNLVAAPGDADWYRVVVCDGGVGEATVRWDPADGDLDLTLYRADGSLTLAAGDGGAGSSTAAANPADGESVVLARVSSVGDACVPYSIELGSGGCGGECTDDVLEDNDTAQTATDLGGPNNVGGLRAAAGDDDWFSIPICAGGTLTTTVTFQPDEGDVNLYLYAADGATLLDASEGAGGVETVSVTTSLETTFLMNVSAGAGACATYRIEASITGCSAGCVDDDAEDDDTAATGTSVPAEGGVYSRSAVRGDRDWFVVPLCRGGTVTARAVFDSTNADVDLRLHGEDGSSVLDVSSSAGGVETVEHQSGVATVVYVEAYVAAGPCTDYTMDIAVRDCAVGCVDDGAEDDDTIGLANDAGAGRVFTDRVLVQDDADYFAVDVCDGGTVVANASFEGPDGEFEMQLLDRDAQTSLDAVTGSGGAASVGATATGTGRRYVRLFTDAAQCFPYDLDISVTGCAAPCDADGYEPDDGPAIATDMSEGGVLNGLTAEIADPDWMRVDLCAGGTVSATATYDASVGPMTVRVYGADGVTPLASSDTGDGLEHVSHRNTLGASSFYLRAAASGDACVPYDLQVVVSGCGGDCQDDALEDNDEPGQAMDLGDDGEVLSGLVAAEGDADWFLVEICPGGTLTATANYTAADGTVGLGIFDRTGTTLIESHASGGGLATVTTINDGAEPQTFTVNAYALGEGCVGYDLQVAVAGCGDVCIDDRLEDNDEAARATPIPPGGLTSELTANDDDWFSVQVCAGGRLNTSLSFAGGTTSMDLRLYGADGTTVIGQDDGGGGALGLEHLSAEDAIYYLRVRDTGAGCTPYTFNASVSGCGVCDDDALEDDDDAASAAVVAPGTISGHIAAPGDPDWFAVQVCGGGNVKITGLWDEARGDLNLTVFDRDGATPLESAPGSAGQVIAEATNPHDEETTLYVQVQGAGSQCMYYTLMLEIDGCGTACEVDAYEDDDSAAEANSVPPTGAEYMALRVEPGDDDWWEIPVCAAGSLVVDSNFQHSDGNLNMRLYAADGVSILASATSWNDGEHLVWNAPADVTAYLRVYVTTSGACVPYDMEVAILCD